MMTYIYLWFYSMNNQQMQLYAVNFIPLLGSLYMFRVFYTPIIRSTILKTVFTATGTDHSIVSATYSKRGLVMTYSCICWLFIEYNMMHGTINIKYIFDISLISS